jgi:hypothetical protein
VAPGGVYNGWCLEDDKNPPLNGTVYPYSSYAPNLPDRLARYTDPTTPNYDPANPNAPIPWDKLNWLLNNKGGATADVIQQAIHLLIWGSTYEDPPLDGAVTLAGDADTLGGGFVPAPGQIIAVLLYVDGIGRVGDPPFTYQDTVIELTVPPYYDRGDLPSTYPTLVADSGPSHRVGPNLFMGQCVDAESDGLPIVSALGDDPIVNAPSYGPCTSSDDEDGVTRVAGVGGSGWTNGTVALGGGGAVQVTITGGPACLGAFFDFAHTGTTVPFVQLRNSDGSPVAQPIPASVTPYTFYFDIVPSAFNGSTSQPIYARFRVTSPVDNGCFESSPAFSPTGPAPDGEVEDYRWNFGPNAVTLSGMTASSAATPLALPLGIVTLLGVLVGGIVLARRPV